MRWIVLVILAFNLSACGLNGEFKSIATMSKASLGGVPSGPLLPPTEPVLPVDDPESIVFKFSGHTWMDISFMDYGIEEYEFIRSPSWVSGAPAQWKDQAVSYTQYSAFIVDHFAKNLLDGPHVLTGTNSLCPNYKNLPRAARIEFWVHFVSAVTKFESGYKPNMRYFETTFTSKDSVTQEQVYSEGLLQLSYQDGKSYKECAKAFNWSEDKLLARTSDEKTIFDPMRNLFCGIRIMDRIIKSKKTLMFDSGNYWAVLKPTGKYGKTAEITKIVQEHNPSCF